MFFLYDFEKHCLKLREDNVFENTKVGDKFTRMLAGTVPMSMVVVAIKDGLLYCDHVER